MSLKERASTYVSILMIIKWCYDIYYDKIIKYCVNTKYYYIYYAS